MYNNKTILVTGGTGSFGQNYIRFLLENFSPKKVIVFSRDELKQFRMQEEFASHKNIRFFLGDVRDVERLRRAFNGVDIVVHAAALKQVPMLEYNPFEAVQTNVLGTQNVITAALDTGVKKVLLISTDKAAYPANLYGATKMSAEKIIIAGNAYSGKTGTKFSVVRYGNVVGSRGSIVETLLAGDTSRQLFLTHKEMTRFWITLDQCFDLVTHALKNMVGGEIFIPKVPSMRVADLFSVLAPGREVKISGIRPGEKLHETLITDIEARTTFDLGKYYAIIPAGTASPKKYSLYEKRPRFSSKTSAYTSDTNADWLDQTGLKKILAHKRFAR